jgi:hypothetical protein
MCYFCEKYSVQDTLNLSCEKLREISWFPKGIVHLQIRGCKNLEKIVLPDTLKTLEIFNTKKLKNLPTFPESLREISLKNLPNLESIPVLPEYTQNLFCSNCPKILHLPPLPESLVSLCVINLKIQNIPNLPKTLRKLSCIKCFRISDIPPLPETLETFCTETNMYFDMRSKFPQGLKELSCYTDISPREFSCIIPDNVRVYKCMKITDTVTMNKISVQLQEYNPQIISTEKLLLLHIN